MYTNSITGAILVLEAGIEPAHPCEREILSLLCLPISPLEPSFNHMETH